MKGQLKTNHSKRELGKWIDRKSPPPQYHSSDIGIQDLPLPSIERDLPQSSPSQVWHGSSKNMIDPVIIRQSPRYPTHSKKVPESYEFSDDENYRKKLSLTDEKYFYLSFEVVYLKRRPITTGQFISNSFATTFSTKF